MEEIETIWKKGGGHERTKTGDDSAIRRIWYRKLTNSWTW